MTTETEQPVASSSKFSKPLGHGTTMFHDSSQYRNWRFSSTQLREMRQSLNTKAQEMLKKNTELEKEAQISLGHEYTDPPPPATYLSVDEELLLIRHYCIQASQIIKAAFNLPDEVETTAISYIKRFYLKNSVMEYHPKLIMPTCIFLAAKTTNYPIPMDAFRKPFAKFDPEDILSTEFLVAQSLMFEFWIRGPEKALRGWILEIQSWPDLDRKQLQAAIPLAGERIVASRYTDLEFTVSPSQVGLACLRLADPQLVDSFLEWKYSAAARGDAEDGSDLPYGTARDKLSSILEDVSASIAEGAVMPEKATLKGIDKRLKSCTNPEKVPGTALYVKRKQEQEAAAAAIQAEKSLKRKQQMDSDSMVFGDIIQPLPKVKKEKTISSPRVSVGLDRSMPTPGGLEGKKNTPTGMGVNDESMGLLEAGQGLKALGQDE